MILTFSLLGVFLNLKLISGLKDIWISYIILSGIGVASAAVVILVLLKNGESHQHTDMQFSLNKDSILLLIT